MASVIAISAAATARHIRSGKPLKVCVLAYDGLNILEYGLATSVFALTDDAPSKWYDFQTISIDPAPVRAAGNVVVNAGSDLNAFRHADLILIPGWKGMDHKVPSSLYAALNAAHTNGARFGALGAGVYVLAQCGLLDGRRATTHWRDIEAFQLRYPAIKVDTNVMFVEDGNILSSAGGVSGLDMCVHIVRGDYGATISNVVARRLVMPSARPTTGSNEGLNTGRESTGDDPAQYFSRPLPRAFHGNIAPLLDKVRESIQEDWGIERMARESHSSARTLQRRFKDATGHSPHMWLTIERIEFAKDLLETTGMNIQNIADVTGLKTPETLRHHFKRLTGTSPTRFRAKFAAGG